jgi:hypothetical protein
VRRRPEIITYGSIFCRTPGAEAYSNPLNIESPSLST